MYRSINSQLRDLLAIQEEQPGLEKDVQFQRLLATLKEFRDEELEHLETAVDQNARKAPMYPILTELIKSGCRVAIKIAERV